MNARTDKTNDHHSETHSSEMKSLIIDVTEKQKIPSSLLEHARELRKRMTDAEELMWELLRNRNFLGLKFRREHPVLPGYILDFYCQKYQLDIEIDGGYHETRDQKDIDTGREQTLTELGIHILRFTNEEVLEQTELVLQRIADAVSLIKSSSLPLSQGRGVAR